MPDTMRRCTTHFRACDCREAEFERTKAENAELREALRELVALKDLKEDSALFGPGKDRRTARADYERRKPAAWDRARALVTSAEPTT